MSIYRGKNKNEIYLASLLYDAIEDTDLRSVKTLLSVKRADPNLVLPKRKISPFHLIIGNNFEKFALEVIILILQHGGNPNVQSDDGLTPIHIAAAWGRYDILKLLLDCGGDPEIRDLNKKTALHYAVEEEYLDCYKLLKLYVTDKASIIFREKEDCINYALLLDKILVNNGTTVGEYEIVNEYKTDSIYTKDLQKLEDLPQSNSNEYIMNWFNSLQQNTPILSNQVIHSNGSTSGISDDSDDSLKESDGERHNSVDIKDICFRKVYRKKVKTPKKKTSPIQTCNRSVSEDNSDYKQYSKESGITLLQDSLSCNTKKDVCLKKFDLEVSKLRDASSDYATCTSSVSPDILERNIFDFNSLITNDETKSVRSQATTISKSEGISSSDMSFVSVSEVYKYVDQQEGIVLYERRFLKTPLSDCNGSVKSFVSSKPSLPESFDYEDCDPEIIRKELTLLGYNPGPVTATTKRVYLKKLKQLKQQPPVVKSSDDPPKRVYSNELEKTLQNADWLKDISAYKHLDEEMGRQFTTPDPSKKWREGYNKSSFTYLLLDPRVTSNLPLRAESLKPQERWEIFLSAVFYVGKGKRSRPYDHLYDAVNLWNQGKRNSESDKLNKILDIWSDDCGVVCLHLFQNTIPVEAYTREAAIIEALKKDNLCNAMEGNFYGVAATWPQKQKAKLGTFLLYKAMMIFLNEGERQLCPTDID
jgi:ankyrin repeat protein